MNPGDRPDSALLNAWIDCQDRDAMGELVCRHIQFIYAVARRQVGGDAHLADDVTQAVFILLLQKAHRIQNEAVMANWLFTTTRYAASNALRMRQRRIFHERTAVSQTPADYLPAPSSIERSEISPLLDDAIGRLSKTDRLCVIMSFLQCKSRSEVAATMGTTEGAVQKRLSRAVERMRESFAARGITTPAAAIVPAIAAACAAGPQASAELIQSTINTATLAQPGPAAAIARAVKEMRFAMQLKIAAAIAVSVILGGFAAAQAVRIFSAPAAPAIFASAQIATTESATEPTSQPAVSNSISLGDGISVKIVGIAPYPAASDQWWGLDGKPISQPADFGLSLINPPKFQIMVSVIYPTRADVTQRIPGARIYMFPQKMPGDFFEESNVIGVNPRPEQSTCDIRVNIADGPWKMESLTIAGSKVLRNIAGGIKATLEPLAERDGKTNVTATFLKLNEPSRIVCKDIDGKIHDPSDGNGYGYGDSGFNHRTMLFDVPEKQISSVELWTRRYNKVVDIRNITLDPFDPATPEFVVIPPRENTTSPP